MISQHFAGREVLTSRCDGSHVNAIRTQRIHADAITEQGTTGSPACRIDRQNGNPHVGITGKESIQNFIGDAAFSSAAGSGDANHRYIPGLDLPFLAQRRELRFVVHAFFDR